MFYVRILRCLVLSACFVLALPCRAATVPDVSRLKLDGQIDLHAQIIATPTIAQGILYMGVEDGNLHAIDLASRKLLWLFHCHGGIASTPAVADGRVYFLSRDGRFHALDAQTGVQLWEFATMGESVYSAFGLYGSPKSATPSRDAWDFYLSSPLVHEGRVYFGSSDERLYALDARSGALQWAFKTGGIVHSSPALSGRSLVFGSWDGAVYAVDAVSGKQQWRYQTQMEHGTSTMLGVQASPLIDDGTVFVGSRDGYFYALNLADGRMLWRHNVGGSWVVSGAVVDAQRVYFGTSDTNRLVALERDSGKPVYQHDTKVWVYATPVLLGDAVLGASMRGELFALHAASGKPLWSWRTPESLADSYGVLDAASGKLNEKRLLGGSMTNNTALEHIKRLGAFLATPLWHEGQLIVATANGKLLFFR